MIEFHDQIKWVHIAVVIASGVLFLLGGIAVQVGARWLSVASDSTLPTAARPAFDSMNPEPEKQ